MTTDWRFDLRLELTEDGYRATVEHSPAGAAWSAFVLPFTSGEQHTIARQLLAEAGDREDRRTEQFTLARTVGGRLFDTIFHGPIRDLWQESWRRAYQERATLRLHLSVGNAPELRILPWEYLYDETREEFIALSVHTPLSRYQSLAHQIRPFPVKPPLRVLVVMAGPEGYPPLAIGREWRDLVDSVDYLAADNRMVFDRLPKPTLLDLQRRLRQQEYHILHFVGFSIYDPQTQEGVLIFEDEMGRGRAVSGQHLGSLLGDHFSLRLALVSIRNAARTAGIEPAAQVIDQLVRRGAPAAVYQPALLRTRPSLAFIHEFYAALAGFGPVDEAMAAARRAIQLEEAGAGWGLPYLAMRVADGCLFERKGPPPAPAKPRLNLRSVLTRR
ncbi:MAG: CHAT domain-containing protein [Caldilineaceae bacterium]|nr:CHAT domain-containing protein [Caldilineaceae bacterium]